MLDAKTRGAIRGGISNVPQLSQPLVEKALASSSLDDERKQKHEILRARAERVHEVANAPRFRESWRGLSLQQRLLHVRAGEGRGRRALRVHLLERYGDRGDLRRATDLRIAFSCLELGGRSSRSSRRCTGRSRS